MLFRSAGPQPELESALTAQKTAVGPCTGARCNGLDWVATACPLDRLVARATPPLVAAPAGSPFPSVASPASLELWRTKCGAHVALLKDVPKAAAIRTVSLNNPDTGLDYANTLRSPKTTASPISSGLWRTGVRTRACASHSGALVAPRTAVQPVKWYTAAVAN